jgi:anti-sigma factor RsiW
MDDLAVTCDRVDRDDLDTRYLAGTLDPDLAEAFEAHCFACDRCWGLVRRGAEVRSAGRAALEAKAPARAWRRPWRWAPLAAAAALALWIGTRPREEPAVGPSATVRGSADSLLVSAASGGGVLRATWSKVADAASYQVRLFTGAGDLAWERRVTDTVLSIARDSIPGSPSGPLFWQVQALDLVGAPLARSALVTVPVDSVAR